MQEVLVMPKLNALCTTVTHLIIGNRQFMVHVPSDHVTSNFVKNLGVYMRRITFFDKHRDVMCNKVMDILMF